MTRDELARAAAEITAERLALWHDYPVTEAGESMLVTAEHHEDPRCRSRVTDKYRDCTCTLVGAVVSIEVEAVIAHRLVGPPIGYWCCAFDWNRGLYRASACIDRTAGDDPFWEKVEGRAYATPDESAIEALKDPRIRAAAEAALARGMERGR